LGKAFLRSRNNNRRFLKENGRPGRICTGVARFFVLVIARCAKRAVAIQLDCFVAAQSAAPRNDRFENTP